MPLAMTLGATTSTSQVLNFSGYAAGGTIQVQYATRPDFNWCVAPSFVFNVGTPYTLQKLNQNTTYYVRAREITSLGVVQPWVTTLGFRTGQTAVRDLTVPAVMIQPAMIVVPETILGFAAPGTVAGYPPENLAFDAPVAWRNSHATAHQVDVNIAGAPIDTIAMLMTNAPEDASIGIYAGATQGATTFSYGVAFRASPNLPGRRGFHALVPLAAAQSYPWWRIVVTAACPGAIFHAEHLILGLNRATKNHSVDKVETPVDYGSLSRNRAGIPDRQMGYRGRRVDFDISMLTEVQHETVYQDLGDRVGSTEPVLVVPNTKSGPFLHDRILYGPIVSQKAVNPASPRYTRSFTIDSLI